MSDIQDKYIPARKAVKILGVHTLTLQNWDKKGKIETIRSAGGHRLYNVEKYLEDSNKNKDKNKKDTRKDVCYVRVSTNGQKDDLERQKEYMMKKYPTYILIEDVGSGINFNRRGLRKIIKMAISGEIRKLVVAYKDRLTRFGFDLIENLIKEYSDGDIIVDGTIKDKDPKDEIVEDVLQILNVYTAKINGLRKYKKI